jgi:hypothetical protein
MPPQEWWKRPEFAPFFGPAGGKNGGQYGYTGVGADGVPQPDRRVPGVGNGKYDAHEAEFIFDADATQAIGPDVLEAVAMGAKSGKVDPNQLRQAVGLPAKPGMQGGGVTYPAARTEPGTGYNPLTSWIDQKLTGGDTKTATVKDDATAVGDDYRTTGMDFLKGVVEGDTPYFQTAANLAVGREAGATIAGTAALKRKAAAAGYGPEAVADIGVTATRDLGSRRSRIIGEMAAKSQELAVGAGQFLATEGRLGQQFEFEKQKYGDTEGWRSYEAAIAAGDFTTAAQAYETVTGNPISMEQMQNYQNYLNTKREQDVAMGEISLEQAQINTDMLRTQLGEEKFNALISRVNAGDTYDMLRADGLLPAGMGGRAQYESLKRLYDIRTGMAETEWAGMELEYETAKWGAAELHRTAAGQKVSGAIDQLITTDPNFITSGAYRDEKEILRPALEEKWGWDGLADRYGAYNPEWDANGRPLNEAAWWTDRQAKAYSISQLDASVNEMKNTDWWRGLDADEQANYNDKIFPAMGQLALFGGLQYNMNDDGSIDIVDTSGNRLGIMGDDGVISWQKITEGGGGEGGLFADISEKIELSGAKEGTLVTNGESVLDIGELRTIVGDSTYTSKGEQAQLVQGKALVWGRANTGKIVVDVDGVPYLILGTSDGGAGGPKVNMLNINTGDKETMQTVWADKGDAEPPNDTPWHQLFPAAEFQYKPQT